MSSRLLFFNEDARILDMIRKGDEEALVRLYDSNRRMVSAFVARNNGTHDDEEDMLQEALVILWERVRSGKFEYSSKLSTFLFATVRNIWFRRLARAKREIPTDFEADDRPDQEDSILDTLIENEESAAVRAAMERIGEQCRQLLLLFYWEERSMEEIAIKLGFANADTVKSKKYQCKKLLENVLKKTLNRYV
ncbi:MAG TPA: sigma-70 family RNA polymerase sigma factor [Bacteroidota bacterium]